MNTCIINIHQQCQIPLQISVMIGNMLMDITDIFMVKYVYMHACMHACMHKHKTVKLFLIIFLILLAALNCTVC